MTIATDSRTATSWAAAIAIACVGALGTDPAAAQIVTDGSLGAQQSFTGQQIAISPTLGQQSGSNLFHSFSDFNVNPGQNVRFDSIAGTTNILARVTGSTASQINGALAANANLFLLNPNGVMFGANASLNVIGAFHASTADYLRMSDGVRFYTSLSQTPTLTTAAPAAFGFLDSSVGPITASGSRLMTGNGRTISLVGGDITLDNATIRVPGGTFNLAAVRSAGEIELGANSLVATGFGAMANIRMNGTVVNASDNTDFASIDETANVFIRGGRLVMENRGGILGHTLNAGAPRIIDIDVDSLQLAAYAGVDIEAANNGASTNIRVEANDIDVTGGGESPSGILVAGGGLQSSGNVTIIAHTLRLHGEGAMIGTGAVANAGRAGNLTVQADTIDIADDAALIALSVGGGAGGAITVNADTLTMRNRASILSAETSRLAGLPGGGNSGPISIQARNITLQDNSVIVSANFGSGIAGSIVINAADTLQMSNNSTISAQSIAGGGGNINLIAGSRILIRESGVVADVGGIFGNGGNITIDPQFVVIDNSRIRASAVGGNGGNISIAGQYVLISPNSTIDASSLLGIDGRLDITGVNVEVNSELVQLPTDFLNAKQWLATPCASRLGADVTQLTVAGRDGSFHSPTDLLTSPLNLGESQVQSAEIAANGASLIAHLPAASFRPMCLQGPG